MSLAAAGLAGAAAALLFGAQRPAARLQALLPARQAPSTAGMSPLLVRSACMLGAVAVWAVLGGVAGALGGLALGLLGPRAVQRLDAGEDDDEQVTRDLPLALDLLAACLAGGAVTLDAVSAVAAATGGPCGRRFGAVASRLEVGSTPAEAWSALGSDRGPAGAAARAMSRAAVGGAPVASAVQQVAEDARRDAAAAAERSARRAGVLAVGPLGLCFLPAFLLLGVVPAVIGLAGPLLGSL